MKKFQILLLTCVLLGLFFHYTNSYLKFETRLWKLNFSFKIGNNLVVGQEQRPA